MMATRIGLLSVLLVSATAASHADTGIQQNYLIKQALQNMQLKKLNDWSYDRTTVLNGTSYVEHFDPAAIAGRHWSLISINGQAPTTAQISKYAAGENPVTGDNLEKSDDGSKLGISDDLPGDLQHKQSLSCLPTDGSSLSVVKDTDQQITFRFKPDCRGLLAQLKQKAMASKTLSKYPEKVKKAEKSAELSLHMLEHTTGTLVVSKAGPYIASIQLANKQPFTEMHVIKIKKLSIENSFGAIAGSKPVLISDVGVMNGTAFFFKTIKQESKVSFSNFVKVQHNSANAGN
jgi:hypothetical protein